MQLICYACSQPAAERREKIVDVEEDQVGECWGICHVCSIVVCTEHGFRNDNPVEYECVYCVGPGFKKRRQRGSTPDDPTPAPETLETLTDAYSRLRQKIWDEVNKARIIYLEENGGDSKTPLNEEALSLAASAYEDASGGTKAKKTVGGTLTGV